MATKTTRRRPLLRVVLPKRIARAQAEAEKTLNRGVKATLDLLPSDTRKTVRELGAQLEEAASDLRTRGRKAVKAVEQRSSALAARVERTVGQLDKRRAQALKRAERQSTQWLDTLQDGAQRVLRTLVETLDVASAREVAQLGRRLTNLERKLGGRATRKRAA